MSGLKIAIGAALLALGAGSALAATPATVPDAVVQVVDQVCRPAADTQTSPSGFAAKAGYTTEPQAPPHLPVGMSGCPPGARHRRRGGST